jgi:hypothetical protein
VCWGGGGKKDLVKTRSGGGRGVMLKHLGTVIIRFCIYQFVLPKITGNPVGMLSRL